MLINDIVAILNLYGPSIRYPDFIEEPTLEEANEAFQMALQIKSFVENKTPLKKRG